MLMMGESCDVVNFLC